MAANINHIIRHAGLNLRLAGNDNGMEVQQDAGRWMEMLFEKLEPALDAMAGEGDWLSLDSLDIEVEVSGNRWQEEALEKVTAKILEAISLHASHTIAETHFSSSTPVMHFAEIYLYFLQHGYLPWNTGAEIRSGWQQQVKQLFKQKETRFAAKLMNLLEMFPVAEKRLLAALPLQVLVEWMMDNAEAFEPAKQFRIRDIHGLLALQNNLTPSPLEKEAEHLLMQLLVINDEAKLENDFSLMVEHNTPGISEMAKAMEDWKPQSPVFTRLKENTGKGKQGAKISGYASQKSSGERYFLKPGNTAGDIQSAYENETLNPTERGNREAENGIYIQNAGLVIAAPYLPMLFKNLDVWKEGKWQNREAAVCLVQFLATGQTAMEEYELVLPKLLCGMAPEDIVDPSGFLPDEKWVKEAEELLNSVIEYWSILKDTSVEGLRGSFLIREGKLVQKENDWQLTVEQRAFDMLLQQLPWNISMLKLPWMQGILYTDWVY